MDKGHSWGSLLQVTASRPFPLGLSRFLKIGLVMVLMVILAGLYLYGTFAQMEVHNSDENEMSRVDQTAYMQYAVEIYQTGSLTESGGRNRMPVYPAFQALFYSPQLSDMDFWEAGKSRNIALSFVLLVGVFFILRKVLTTFAAFMIMLLVAFTVFIFKAPYFQAEILYYFFYFCTFILLVRLFVRPSWKLAALAGGVAGLAHLTKASVLPTLMLFVAFFGAKIVFDIVFHRHGEHVLRSSSRQRAIALVVGVVVFLVTVFPYIQASKEIYGQYFYNVNSTFYIWYDSWAEAEQGTKAAGDREGWPDLPPDEIPSLASYLDEHSRQEIINRLRTGMTRLVETNCRDAYGYCHFAVLYVIFLGVVMIINFAAAWHLLRRHVFLAGFTVSTFVIGLVLTAWYMPIADGPRLSLAYFLPFITLIAMIIHALPLRNLSILNSKVRWLGAFHVIVTAVLAWDVYIILTDRITDAFGGR